MPALKALPGVERITDFGSLQELRISGDADPQKIAAEIMTRTKIYSFDLAKPTLYDIFLRIAGPEAKERDDA